MLKFLDEFDTANVSRQEVMAHAKDSLLAVHKAAKEAHVIIMAELEHRRRMGITVTDQDSERLRDSVFSELGLTGWFRSEHHKQVKEHLERIGVDRR